MKGLSSRSHRVFLVGLVSLGLIALGSAGYAGVDPAALCQEKKAKATGKKAFDQLKAYGKDAKKPNGAKLAADISKSESKFQKAFSKAEAKGECADGDAARARQRSRTSSERFSVAVAVSQETVTIPSGAEPAETPGSPGVDDSAYPKLVTMFGGTDFSLNNATYTRHFCGDGTEQPDAILILIPGFEGGAANFKILAENAVPRALGDGMNLEVWALDRRGHQIEDRAGLVIAEAQSDAADPARLVLRRGAGVHAAPRPGGGSKPPGGVSQ